MHATPTRTLTVVGVPIDSLGTPGGTELAPGALREAGVAGELGARDAGDLAVRIAGTERDLESGIVGYPSVVRTCEGVRDGIEELLRAGAFPVVLGGCCALVPGVAAGVRRASPGPAGLAYVDGHLDLYDGRTSPTGEAADMPVAGLLGYGWSGLLATMGAMPVIAGRDIVVLGARDEVEAADIGDLPVRLGLRVHSPADIARDPGALGRATRERFTVAAVPYWMHLDLDVLDEAVFPATDYLMPGGIDLEQLAELLRPLGHDAGLIGFSVGCYNPEKDPDGRYGAALVDLLLDVLGGGLR
jgi:arginase